MGSLPVSTAKAKCYRLTDQLTDRPTDRQTIRLTQRVIVAFTRLKTKENRIIHKTNTFFYLVMKNQSFCELCHQKSDFTFSPGTPRGSKDEDEEEEREEE